MLRLSRFVRLSLAAAVALVTAWASADAETKAVLTIRLGLRNAKGQVGCLLFNTPKGYPGDENAAIQRRWCSITGAESVCPFEPMGAGTYAVACFHDENKNGKLDTSGLFDIPSEGTAASNDAKGFMGPPKFEDAKFVFAAAPREMRLKMNY